MAGPQIPHPFGDSAVSPWTAHFPDIVLDERHVKTNPSYRDLDYEPGPSPLEYPDSARSTCSSISSHDPRYNVYLLARPSPSISPYSEPPVTPISIISTPTIKCTHSQLGCAKCVTFPEPSKPDSSSQDIHLFPTAPSERQRSEGESDIDAIFTAGRMDAFSLNSSAHATSGFLSNLGNRSDANNSSNSTLRLNLGYTHDSIMLSESTEPSSAATSSNFSIPDGIEDDDEPVPEYTESKNDKRKSQAKSPVPTPPKDCFQNDPLRRTLVNRIMVKPWFRAHQFEPRFLSKEDDISEGLVDKICQEYGMKKGDSIFKVFEGVDGTCPFDGCRNIEPRPNRRVTHVRSHFNLRPYACDGKGCMRCQARIDKGQKPRRFFTVYYLTEHRRPLDSVNCTICGDAVLKNNMARHCETKHGIPKKRKSAPKPKAYVSRRQP